MFGETARFFGKHILKLFLLTLGVIILLTVAFFCYYKQNPMAAIEEMQSFKAATANLITSDNKISFVALFLNNIKAGTLYLLFGFIAPLSILVTVILTKSLGAALVYSQVENSIPAWKSLLANVLPHGIFELSAVCLCVSIGLYIGTYWFRKNKIYKGKQLAKYTIILYTGFIVPLMLLAALIEAYLTPQIGAMLL